MLLNFICLSILPITFIILGLAFWKRPPKEINYSAGWRSKRAMKNQDTWNYANRLCGKCFLILGIIEFVITWAIFFAASILNIDSNIVQNWGPVLLFIQAACITFIGIYIERKLKERFH